MKNRMWLRSDTEGNVKRNLEFKPILSRDSGSSPE